jgi:hypothetical protein
MGRSGVVIRVWIAWFLWRGREKLGERGRDVGRGDKKGSSSIPGVPSLLVGALSGRPLARVGGEERQ